MATARRWRAASWRLVFAGAVAACLLVFLANAVFGEVRPASAWGISYGSGAAALLVGAALLGVRRRSMRFATKHRLGGARAWLRFHLYGGGLFVLLVLMHSGFRLPTGTLTWWLWGLSLWTVASGLVGLALQRWIPKVLGSALSIEALYDRIPELVDEIRAQGERLAATAGEPVRRLYADEVEPRLERPRRRWIYFLDITGGIRSRMQEIDYLRRFLTGDDRETLDELARLLRTKLELDAHYTLQTPLRWWMVAHAPVSVALLALLAVHLFTVAYY